MAKYFGSECKTGGCVGHKAGAKYVRDGGRTRNRKSPSFDKGSNIQAKRMRKRGMSVRLT